VASRCHFAAYKRAPADSFLSKAGSTIFSGKAPVPPLYFAWADWPPHPFLLRVQDVACRSSRHYCLGEPWCHAIIGELHRRSQFLLLWHNPAWPTPWVGLTGASPSPGTKSPSHHWSSIRQSRRQTPALAVYPVNTGEAAACAGRRCAAVPESTSPEHQSSTTGGPVLHHHRVNAPQHAGRVRYFSTLVGKHAVVVGRHARPGHEAVGRTTFPMWAAMPRGMLCASEPPPDSAQWYSIVLYFLIQVQSCCKVVKFVQVWFEVRKLWNKFLWVDHDLF
jgi:hypothetical protein